MTLPNAKFVEYIAPNLTGIDQKVARVVTIFTSARLKPWIGTYSKQNQLNVSLINCVWYTDYLKDKEHYLLHFQIKTFCIQLHLFRKLLCQGRSNVYLDTWKTKSLQAVSIRKIPIFINGKLYKVLYGCYHK